MIPFEEIKRRYREIRLQVVFRFDGEVFEVGNWDVKFVEREDIVLCYKVFGGKPFVINNIHPKCGIGVDVGYAGVRVYGNQYSSIEDYLRSRSQKFRKHLKKLDRMWEGGKVVFEKKIFTDFNEYYDAFELYFRKLHFLKEFSPPTLHSTTFYLIQNLPVWVISLYEPRGNFVGRNLLVQIDDDWYQDFCFSWDESYKNLCPGTYVIWSILKHFIIGKNAVYDASDIGIIVPSGGVEFDGICVRLRNLGYVYKARFGVSRVFGIYIDRNNILGLPNVNKITENEYFKFPD